MPRSLSSVADLQRQRCFDLCLKLNAPVEEAEDDHAARVGCGI
jgi:hypothetical protein